TYRGNVFNGTVSISGGTADARNNVESVFLPAGVTGPFTVTVLAANINSDGVPNNSDSLDQDFALVIYNASDRDTQLVPAGAALEAESCSPGQGAIDPGETVTVGFALRNLGPSNTTALVATLLPSGGVVSPSAPQTYGVVTGNDGPAVSRSFSFVAAGECGGSLTASLQLQDGTNDYGIVQFALQLGSLNTNQVSVSNSAPIAISATDGIVSPYPSEVTVSGLAGRIQQATVTLHGLSHTWPDDLDILLVSPSGASVLLLSDAGGGNNVTNLTLTFDANAANLLPDDGPLNSGTWQPSLYENDTPFPAPAPATASANSLSALAGTDPNGSWKLFVMDDYGSDDGGVITGDWRLTLVTTNRICCVDPASADLALGAQATPGPVALSNTVTYTFSVTNQGPATATAARLAVALSPSALLMGATLSQGTWSESAGTVTCQLGTLPPGAVATVLIQTLALTGPRLTATAVVSATELDPNLRNNQASLTTAVSVPALTIQDTSVVEGDGATTYAVFLLTLSQPATQPIQVDYFTTNGTASAGADYTAQTNRLTFLAGE
ncbi:MAG TPA: proprotein convertase P-domain-containing protein, partial [Bacillota bacterium]|nr:proprotein convertase P-domain-containing protein [Bacillota bacterium]